MQAAQITFEDYFMADLSIAPLKIVGWEGVFGTLLMVVIVLPIVYFLPGVDGEGFHENTLETLHVSRLSCSNRDVKNLSVLLVQWAKIMMQCDVCLFFEGSQSHRTIVLHIVCAHKPLLTSACLCMLMPVFVIILPINDIRACCRCSSTHLLF